MLYAKRMKNKFFIFILLFIIINIIIIITYFKTIEKRE